MRGKVYDESEKYKNICSCIRIIGCINRVWAWHNHQGGQTKSDVVFHLSEEMPEKTVQSVDVDMISTYLFGENYDYEKITSFQLNPKTIHEMEQSFSDHNVVSQDDVSQIIINEIIPSLVNLEVLEIKNVVYEDICVLSGLTNLKELSLSHTQITDVSALSGLTKLKILYLLDNHEMRYF